MDASDMVCFNRAIRKLDNIYNKTPDLHSYDPIFANNTWEMIAKASEEKVANWLWKTDGSCTKDITLKTGETLTMEILGFNHDPLADGSGYAGLSIGMKELMAVQRRMGESGTSASFSNIELGNYLNNDLYNQLPDDLKSFIKTVRKNTCINGRGYLNVSEDVKIFLFSEIEVSNTRSYSGGNEGIQYQRFKDPYSRIKKLSNGAGIANKWWERSPADNTNHCCVGSNGYVNRENSENLAGVCFGFCI